MKIFAIQKDFILQQNYSKQNTGLSKCMFNKGLTADVFLKSKEITFCGVSNVSSVEEELSYSNFIREYLKQYGKTPLNEVIYNVIQNNEELNHGGEKRVFIFPKLKDYLIAYLYNKPRIGNNLPIEESINKYPKYNFGQPLAGNGYDIQIIKYVHGVPSSVDNYFSNGLYLCMNNRATEEMARTYLSKLRLIEHFPQEAYDDLAQKFKYLQDNGAFVDIINCNNLLIDTHLKKFQLIDIITDKNDVKRAKNLSEHLGGETQGAYDMISLILDPRFQPYYLEQMSPEQQKETIDISKNVINKCLISANKLCLSTNTNMVNGFIYYLQRIHPEWSTNFSRRYSEFLELYRI